MEQILYLVTELGFSVTGALASGYFVFLTLKFILSGVTSSILEMEIIIKALDARISSMINELHSIDTRVSHALGLNPDYTRISRTLDRE